MRKYILAKYILLISDFLNQIISVEKFERYYLDVVNNEIYQLDEHIDKVISELFCDVDSFCGDEAIANYNLSDPFHDIDEHELRKRAAKALSRLKTFYMTL